MKTITLDFDLYEKELRDARNEGIRSGIWKACEYIRSPKSYTLSGDENYRNRKDLDEALEKRMIEYTDEKFIQALIDKDELLVFNLETASLDSVVSYCFNGPALQLQIGKVKDEQQADT
jgi:hypothetical protein